MGFQTELQFEDEDVLSGKIEFGLQAWKSITYMEFSVLSQEAQNMSC